MLQASTYKNSHKKVCGQKESSFSQEVLDCKDKK